MMVWLSQLVRTLTFRRSRFIIPSFCAHVHTDFDFSPEQPYRNRYTHYRKAYPGKPNYGYNLYLLIILLSTTFFFCGGGTILENWEADYIANERKKRKELVKKVDCQAIGVPSASAENFDQSNLKSNEKKCTSFRDRKFIAYEDRIRAYSTPDKIFRYFATLKSIDEDGEVTIYMTPDDFVRSITPGLRQPEGLELDSFMRYDPKTDHLDVNVPKDSVFYRLCDKALLTFSDFIFLLTVLSTPRRQFEIAFKMFDLNGDGEVDADEFDVVRSVIMDTTAMGRRHRDHTTTGSTIKKRSNSALQHYFFGPDGKQKLTIKRFLEFHSQLQEEIIKLEFNRADPKHGKITEVQFANFLLVYAGFSEPKRRKMMRSVKQKFASSENSPGISYQDFSDFNLLLRSIGDVDTALSFYHMAGAAIDRPTLEHVAMTVANVKLSPHVIDVVFTLFDENNDGELSYREFVGVMRNRMLRGLDKPMDTGFIRFVSALCSCAMEQLPVPPFFDR